LGGPGKPFVLRGQVELRTLDGRVISAMELQEVHSASRLHPTPM
jgi:hypothetical protein